MRIGSIFACAVAGLLFLLPGGAVGGPPSPHVGTRSLPREECPDPATTTVEEQRACGEQVYKTVCWECHEEEDGEGTILDPELLADYDDAFSVYDYISYSMPDDDPGMLPLSDYWAVTAYLLDSRGLLQDTDLLTPENAKEIQLGN